MTPPSHSDPKLTFAKDSEQRPGMMINSQGHVDGNSGREHWILKVQAPQQWRTTKKYLGCGQVFHSLHSLNTSNFKIVGIMCVVKAPFQTDLADRNSEHSRNFQNNLKNGNPSLYSQRPRAPPRSIWVAHGKKTSFILQQPPWLRSSWLRSKGLDVCRII